MTLTEHILTCDVLAEHVLAVDLLSLFKCNMFLFTSFLFFPPPVLPLLGKFPFSCLFVYLLLLLLHLVNLFLINLSFHLLFPFLLTLSLLFLQRLYVVLSFHSFVLLLCLLLIFLDLLDHVVTLQSQRLDLNRHIRARQYAMLFTPDYYIHISAHMDLVHIWHSIQRPVL